jgi:hypothetical protein
MDMATIAGQKDETNLTGSDTNITTRAEDQQSQRLSSTEGMSGIIPTYSTTQAKAPAQQGSTAGERFRSLRSYIDKSKANMAGRIGQGLQQREQAAVGEIGQAGQKLQRDIDEEKQRQSGATTFGFPANQGVDAKTNVASTLQNLGEVGEEQTRTFQDLITGAGPNLQVAGAANLGQSVGQLKETARGLGTEQGRFEELRRNLGTGRGYSAGAQQLDQLLLQTQKNEASKLKELQKTVGVESGRQLEGLARTAETEASALGQQSKNIAEALRGGLTDAQSDVIRRSERAMQDFKESSDYAALKEGGYSEEEILNYMLPFFQKPVKGGTITTKGGISAGGELLTDFYGLRPEEIKNLMSNEVNQIRGIDSYKGMLSERDAGVLKNLGLLGGSAVPIQSAEDLGYTDVASVEDIRRSALDKVMDSVSGRKQQYDKIEAEKNKVVAELDTQKNTEFAKIDELHRLRNKVNTTRGAGYQAALNEYHNAMNYFVDKYGIGLAHDGASNPNLLKNTFLTNNYTPQMTSITNQFNTDTAQFRRPK